MHQSGLGGFAPLQAAVIRIDVAPPVGTEVGFGLHERARPTSGAGPRASCPRKPEPARKAARRPRANEGRPAVASRARSPFESRCAGDPATAPAACEHLSVRRFRMGNDYWSVEGGCRCRLTSPTRSVRTRRSTKRQCPSRRSKRSKYRPLTIGCRARSACPGGSATTAVPASSSTSMARLVVTCLVLSPRLTVGIDDYVVAEHLLDGVAASHRPGARHEGAPFPNSSIDSA